jgi:hypothetical protein
MNRVKYLGVFALAALLTAAAVNVSKADDAKTITGTSSCGGCSGVSESCSVMLTDKDGAYWVLKGDSDSVKAAFKARHNGKKMTATYSGTPETKKGENGKEYKEVKVTDVKIES